MDQNALVNSELASGWHLIDALSGHNFEVKAAFWARLIDTERWVLYLASPKVDEVGSRAAYQIVHAVLRGAPEWGFDLFTVSVLGANDSMAKAAADLVKPKTASGPFATSNPKPYRGVTRFSGSSLGGVQIDGAYIYPPWEPAINPVG